MHKILPVRFMSALLIAALLSANGYALIVHADDTASSTPPVVTDTSTPTGTGTSTPTVPPAPMDMPVVATDTASTNTTASSTISTASTTPATAATSTDPTLALATTTTTSVSTTTLPVSNVSTTGTSTDATSTTTANMPDTATATSTASTTQVTASTTPTILSGTAVALANILNIINTNFVNSTGSAYLLNYIDPVTGTIDLRDASSTLANGSVCATYLCLGQQATTVNLQSNGQINNAIVLDAATGGNSISANGSNAAIQTGNAYAGLNLINLANTNVVNSNYLLVTLNAFNGVNGDIVFPNLTTFFNQLAYQLGTPNSVQLTSSAGVDNSINTSADSGGNTSTASTTNITTGAANSSSNVFNQLNGNMIGGSNIALLFRVQGSWAWQVFSAPTGLGWTTDANGHVVLLSMASSTGSTSVPGTLNASSTALIHNDVSVVALTGQNHVDDANAALITTGNANASANVINVANQNIVSKNWIFAIINIFGDFNGNIAFGQPDLWVGEQVKTDPFIENGSKATYTLTVINNGDADATSGKLVTTYDRAHLSINDASLPYSADDSGKITWNIGTVPAGKAVQITYDATVVNSSPGAVITTSATATEHEDDGNPADNTDSISFTMSTPSPSSGLGPGLTQSVLPVNSPLVGAGANAPGIIVTRKEAAITLSGSHHVAHEQIDVYNADSATTTPIILHDSLTDPHGSLVRDLSWDLGVVRPHEQVQITYGAQFAASATVGTYTLSSAITDEQNHVLRTFANNGSIVLVPTTGSTHHVASSHTSATTTPATTTPAIASRIDLGTPTAYAAGNALLANANSSKIPGTIVAILSVFSLLLLLAALYRTRRRSI